MQFSRPAELILRIGAAFAFLYPPLAAVHDPVSWFGYFPQFIQDLPVNHLVLLHGFGLLEVIIAVWILVGKKILIPSALATLILLAIVTFNWSQLDVIFRDLSIATITAALAVEAWGKSRRTAA